MWRKLTTQRSVATHSSCTTRQLRQNGGLYEFACNGVSETRLALTHFPEFFARESVASAQVASRVGDPSLFSGNEAYKRKYNLGFACENNWKPAIRGCEQMFVPRTWAAKFPRRRSKRHVAYFNWKRSGATQHTMDITLDFIAVIQ